MKYAPHCNMSANVIQLRVVSNKYFHTETAEAVRQYLHASVLDGFPVYAAGWRLVSAPYSSLIAVRDHLRHVIRCCCG